MRAFLRAVLAVVAIGWVAAAAAAADPVGANPPGVAKYAFLKNSRWYVPWSTLPALSFDLATGTANPAIDQTVWDITDYRYGYFWGRTVALLRNADTHKPLGPPSCRRMVGSVTTDGKVQISFVDQDQTTAMGAILGTGLLALEGPGSGEFRDMQMITGITSLVAHSSYMVQCKPGQSCVQRLPGTSKSLAQFLALCPS